MSGTAPPNRRDPPRETASWAASLDSRWIQGHPWQKDQGFTSRIPGHSLRLGPRRDGSRDRWAGAEGAPMSHRPLRPKYRDGVGGLLVRQCRLWPREIADDLQPNDAASRLPSPFDRHHQRAGRRNLLAKLASLARSSISPRLLGCLTRRGTAIRESTRRCAWTHYYPLQARRRRRSAMPVRASAAVTAAPCGDGFSSPGKPRRPQPPGNFVSTIGSHHLGTQLSTASRSPGTERGRSSATAWWRSWRRRSWSSAPNSVACFFAEPVLGAGGVLVPPGLSRADGARRVCRWYDACSTAPTVSGDRLIGHLRPLLRQRDVFTASEPICHRL